MKNDIQIGDSAQYIVPCSSTARNYVNVEVVLVHDGNFPLVELNNGHSARWNGRDFELVDLPSTLEFIK